MVDDDDPVKDAGRELAAAARAVATGVAVAARAKADRQAARASQEARRLEVRGRANGAWRDVEERNRPRDLSPDEPQAVLAERHRRETQQEQQLARD